MDTRKYLRVRWQAWLGHRMQRSGVSASRLTQKANSLPMRRRIFEHGSDSRREIPVSRIGTWVREGRPGIGAETAYRIGEALRLCGDAGASGPVAMHAAGHGQKTLRFLRALARSRSGARNAVVLYCLLPRINAWLDHLRPELQFGAPGRNREDEEECKNLGAALIDEIDAEQLEQEKERLLKPRGMSQAPEQTENVDSKLERYQNAWLLSLQSEEFTSPRETNLFQADAFARDIMVAVNGFYERLLPEFAACESWWLFQRWAKNAHPFRLERIAEHLGSYFWNLDSVDPKIENLEFVPDGELFVDTLLNGASIPTLGKTL